MTEARGVRPIALIVAAALFMTYLDSTALSTALPRMARDLDVGVAELSTVITSYLVAIAVLLPASGWLADRFGVKRVFIIAVSVYTAASCWCFYCHDLQELVVGRVMQGVGASMMTPVGRIALLRSTQKHELLSATLWLSVPAMLGPLIGPTIGGLLTEAFSWRAIFWVNGAIGAPIILAAAFLLPNSRAESRVPPDLVGMFLSGAALSSLMFGLETLGRGALPSQLPWLSVSLGIFMSVLAVRHCRRAPHPAIDLSLLSVPTFYIANLTGGALFRIAAGAMAFLVSITLQVVLGLTPSESGLTSVAGALGALFIRPMSRLFLERFSMRSVILWCTLGYAAVLLTFTQLTAEWPVPLAFGLLLCGGVFRSLNFACMGALAYADIPKEKLSSASSLSSTAQQLPRAVGVTLASGTLQIASSVSGHAELHAADFARTFFVIAAVVFISVPLFAALRRDAAVGILKPERDRPAG